MTACRKKETEIHQDYVGHITKIAAMSISGKQHFKNLFFKNHWADFDENLYEASEI